MSKDYIEHYGTPRHSGRYPWGSGDKPKQRNREFLDEVELYRKKGFNEVQISRLFGLTTTDYRARISQAVDEERRHKAALAQELKDKGLGPTAIGRAMGINESSVRTLLKYNAEKKTDGTQEIAEVLKHQMKTSKYLDVGDGVEVGLGIPKSRLDNAVKRLEAEGYEVHNVKVKQVTTGNNTTIKTLCPPETKWAEVQNNKDKIDAINAYSPDEGFTLRGIKPPVSISSSRVKIRYAEDGGIDKDGVIELRRGVNDLDLGKSRYAQVRIAVDGTHYLKGMAMYSDNIPKGVDIVFNTNKKKGTPALGDEDSSVLKLIKDDPNNPFGATISCQKMTKDGKKLSPLNIVNEEGKWETWSRSLSSQFLGKQPDSLVKRQLGLAADKHRSDLDEILGITNPVVKKKLLEEFADNADSAAVHLKGAALPRTQVHVLLPLPKIKPDEVYAPNYKDGERLALVRFPHGGKFEIPMLTVNNNSRHAKSVIGKDAKDALGIHPKVAERLSGADFDGDFVLTIPVTKRSAVKNAPPLEGLKNFDTKIYKNLPGMPKTCAENGFHEQRQMGSVSNLITDMTIKGATTKEIERAVKHSMVVIDSNKHNLDWRRSEIDNNIKELKKKYQGRENAGASTLLSKASSDAHIKGVRKELNNPSKMTPQQLKDWKAGKKIYQIKKETYVDKNGVTKERTTKSSKMAETDNAFSLVSDKKTSIEMIYARHANQLKNMADEARKEARAISFERMSPSAKKVYSKEVNSLNSKLKIAWSNKPLERQAQIIANDTVSKAKKENPNMSKDDAKKLKNQAINGARLRVGKKPYTIDITPKEWEAIQARAVSANILSKLLDAGNSEQIRQYATPRKTKGMTKAKVARARALIRNGYTRAEVASMLGVSVSTLSYNEV